ncbi:MAG TPA: hypothetical protein VJ654_01190 [Noviherbaspirillum sp.]|nr:hypothetical protein [Noviherbaspirillum sp.]
MQASSHLRFAGIAPNYSQATLTERCDDRRPATWVALNMSPEENRGTLLEPNGSRE